MARIATALVFGVFFSLYRIPDIDPRLTVHSRCGRPSFPFCHLPGALLQSPIHRKDHPKETERERQSKNNVPTDEFSLYANSPLSHLDLPSQFSSMLSICKNVRQIPIVLTLSRGGAPCLVNRQVARPHHGRLLRHGSDGVSGCRRMVPFGWYSDAMVRHSTCWCP